MISDFLANLYTSPLNNVYSISDSKEAFAYWLDQFWTIYDKPAPLYTRRVKYFSKP